MCPLGGGGQYVHGPAVSQQLEPLYDRSYHRLQQSGAHSVKAQPSRSICVGLASTMLLTSCIIGVPLLQSLTHWMLS
jgi:hypothetical protein